MKEAAIGVIFSEDESSLLLIKRRDVPVWVLPGGGIDPGESPEKAVCREVEEETGFVVAIKRQIAVYTPINRLSAKTYLYECKIVGGFPKKTDETQDINFFPVERLPKSFFIVHQDWLKDALAHDPKVIEKPISRVTYWNVIKHLVLHPVHVVRYLLSRLGFAINSKPFG